MYFDASLIDGDPEGDICIYNDGVYPYIPVDYKFLKLAVGYAKERDEAIVEVVNITFEPMKQKDGSEARFDEINGKFEARPNGRFAFWMVNYHLGEIIETK